MLLTFSKTGPRFASFLFSVLRFPKLPKSNLAPLRNRKLTSCSHRVLEAWNCESLPFLVVGLVSLRNLRFSLQKKMKPGVLTLALRQLFFRLSQRLNIFGNCMIFFTIFANGRVTGGFIYTGASFKRLPCLQSKVIKCCGTETFEALRPDESMMRRRRRRRGELLNTAIVFREVRGARDSSLHAHATQIVVVASVHRGTMYFGRDGALNSSFCFLLPFHSDNRVSHA